MFHLKYVNFMFHKFFKVAYFTWKCLGLLHIFSNMFISSEKNVSFVLHVYLIQKYFTLSYSLLTKFSYLPLWNYDIYNKMKCWNIVKHSSSEAGTGVCSAKKANLKNLTKFTGKHPYLNLFFDKFSSLRNTRFL